MSLLSLTLYLLLFLLLSLHVTFLSLSLTYTEKHADTHKHALITTSTRSHMDASTPRHFTCEASVPFLTKPWMSGFISTFSSGMFLSPVTDRCGVEISSLESPGKMLPLTTAGPDVRQHSSFHKIDIFCNQ